MILHIGKSHYIISHGVKGDEYHYSAPFGQSRIPAHGKLLLAFMLDLSGARSLTCPVCSPWWF